MSNTKILSIDWDYFFDCGEGDRVILFPDGGEFKESLGNIIWAGYYRSLEVDDYKSINDVTVDKKAFDYIMKWAKNTDLSNTITASSISHLSIVHMVKEFNIKDIDIINIDYHHDTFKHIENDINCGNWLSHFIKDNNARARWVKREDSGLESIGEKIEVTTDISIIENFIPDYIFLAKSNMWSPPHLDADFNKLYRTFFNNSSKLFSYTDLREMNNRYTKVKEIADAENDAFKKLDLQKMGGNKK